MISLHLSVKKEIKNLETKHTTDLWDLDLAKSQLKINGIELNLGMITELDLLKNKLSVMRQEEALRSLIYDHAIRVKQLNKAYL